MSIHEKEDLFSHLPVNVANDGIDIYDGLSKYFDDVVEYEGGKTRMEISIVDLPPILQIQLQVWIINILTYLLIRIYDYREFNSIETHSNRTNPRPTSNLLKIFSWTGSWITLMPQRRADQRLSKANSALAEIACAYLLKIRLES